MIFQSSEFGTDEIYANMEEYIMQITRDNYSQYASYPEFEEWRRLHPAVGVVEWMP